MEDPKFLVFFCLMAFSGVRLIPRPGRAAHVGGDIKDRSSTSLHIRFGFESNGYVFCANDVENSVLTEGFKAKPGNN